MGIRTHVSVLVSAFCCLAVLALALPASAGKTPTAFVVDGRAVLYPGGRVDMTFRTNSWDGIHCDFRPRLANPDLRGALCGPRSGWLYREGDVQNVSPSLWVSITTDRVVVFEYRKDKKLHLLQRFERR
ncbi:MAG: hypothetical protein LC118_13220 [Dehalococcoidia bacterium]|nr:hypothetical protein [Dehalococcoidia bacterium]